MLVRRVFRRAYARLGLWALLCSSVAQVASAQPSAAARAEQGGKDDYTRAIQSAVEAYNRDDFATARKFFARAHELRPSARTWRGMGTTAFELRHFQDAVRELTSALEDRRSPLTPELRSETELTLRVAERRLKESEKSAPAAAAPTPSAAAASARSSPPSAAEPAAETEGLGGQRIAALVAGGLGVVGVGVGVAFGVVSMNKGNDRDRDCPSHVGCSPQAVAAADAAIDAGNISTVAFVAGGALLVGGVVLWLTGGSEERQPTAAVTFAPGSVAVSGRF
jgi:hypothetical protein